MDSPEKLRVDALNAMHGAAKAEGEGVWKELVMALLSPEWPDEYTPDEYATERQEVLSAQVWIAVAIEGMFDYGDEGESWTLTLGEDAKTNILVFRPGRMTVEEEED